MPTRAEITHLANRLGYQLFRASESTHKYKVVTPLANGKHYVTLKRAWILFANPTRHGWKHFRTLKAVAQYIRTIHKELSGEP